MKQKGDKSVRTSNECLQHTNECQDLFQTPVPVMGNQCFPRFRPATGSKTPETRVDPFKTNGVERPASTFVSNDATDRWNPVIHRAISKRCHRFRIEFRVAFDKFSSCYRFFGSSQREKRATPLNRGDILFIDRFRSRLI